MTQEINPHDLQTQMAEWSLKNFGGKHGTGYRPLLGVMEELGELAHAHLKNEQGIRRTADHHAAKVDAIGDIIIYLMDYCTGQGIHLWQAVLDTWDHVKTRDWQSNPEDGGRKDTRSVQEDCSRGYQRCHECEEFDCVDNPRDGGRE